MKTVRKVTVELPDDLLTYAMNTSRKNMTETIREGLRPPPITRKDARGVILISLNLQFA